MKDLSAFLTSPCRFLAADASAAQELRVSETPDDQKDRALGWILGIQL